MVLVKSIIAIFLVIYSGISSLAQLHPGPRATCPICIARTLKLLKSSSDFDFSALPRSEKRKIIVEKIPGVNSDEILKILDNDASLSLKHLHIETDNTFQARLMEFGDGSNKPFYTVKTSSGEHIYSSNRAIDIFDNLSRNGGNSKTTYVLLEDLYSQESQNFMRTLGIYNSRNRSKIVGLPTDIYPINGKYHVWGGAYFARAAKLTSVTSIEPELVGGVQKYSATINYVVQGKRIATTIIGRTRKAVQEIIDRTVNYLAITPEASVARAVNNSRLQRIDVDIIYREADVTQFVINSQELKYFRINPKKIHLDKPSIFPHGSEYV